MRIVAEQQAVAEAFNVLADLVLAAGGQLHPGLCLHQQGSAMWASIDAQALAADPDAFLMTVPETLLVPIAGLKWDGADSLQASAGLDTLSPLQQRVLQQMLALYALTSKLTDVPPRLAALVLPLDSVLAPLLRSGHPHWATRESSVTAHFLNTRVLHHETGSDSGPADVSGKSVLMPLIDTLNHRPDGASYKIRQGSVRVKVRTFGNDNQCFACYGYKDAMAMLLHYGYVDHQPRFLQSIACELCIQGFGNLQILGQGHRRSPMDLPWVDVVPDGLSISHLNLDTDRPERAMEVLRILASGLRPTLSPAKLELGVQIAFDAVCTANVKYYSEMLALGRDAISEPKTGLIVEMLDEVAHHQLALLSQITASAAAQSTNSAG